MTKNNTEYGMQAGRKKKIWVLLSLFVFLAAGLLLPLTDSSAEDEKKAAKPAPQGMPVEAVQVTTDSLDRKLNAVGSLLSDESVVITAEISGLVKSVQFEEGKKAKAGDVLIKLDDSVLKAEFDRVSASLELSQANYKRAEKLLQEDAISQRERDEAYAKWQLDEANLRLAEANLAKTVIRAPFSGRLGLRNISPGSYLRPGDTIVDLDAIDPIKVDFQVPEAYAGQVGTGQALAVRVDAVPGRTFDGKVIAIAPQLDETGRSLMVRARIPNSEGFLNPGMFARIDLLLEEKPETILVPEEALMAKGMSQLVYKVVDGKVEVAPVKTGARLKGRVEILEGLEAGETIITAGHLKVRPGMPVTVLPPASTGGETKGGK